MLAVVADWMLIEELSPPYLQEAHEQIGVGVA